LIQSEPDYATTVGLGAATKRALFHKLSSEVGFGFQLSEEADQEDGALRLPAGLESGVSSFSACVTIAISSIRRHPARSALALSKLTRERRCCAL